MAKRTVGSEESIKERGAGKWRKTPQMERKAFGSESKSENFLLVAFC